MDAEVSPGQLNAYLYGENDEFLGGFGFGAIRSEQSYWGSVKAGPVDYHVEETVLRERLGMMTMTAEVTTQGPSTFKMLVWGAGRQVASWQTGVRGDGIEILGVEKGSSAWVSMAKEFDAPVNVDAHVLAGGRATVLGERVVEVKDSLVGWYNQMSMTVSHTPPWTPNGHLLTATTPQGDQICNPFGCAFNAMTGPSRAGPGSYTFKVSGAGAGLAGSDDVMLNIVDARLPSIITG